MDVKFLGTTDDVTTCDCCGKKNLKSTVALSIDDGDAVHFGVSCAARAIRQSAAEVRKGSAKADQEKARIEAEKREAESRAKSAPWFAFLAAHGKGGDVFHQIESLGGYKAARASFEASIAE